MDKRKKQIAIDSISNAIEIAQFHLKNETSNTQQVAEITSNAVKMVIDYLPPENQLEIADKLLEYLEATK